MIDLGPACGCGDEDDVVAHLCRVHWVELRENSLFGCEECRIGDLAELFADGY